MKIQRRNSDSLLNSYNMIKQYNCECDICDYIELLDTKYCYRCRKYINNGDLCDECNEYINIKNTIDTIFNLSFVCFAVVTLLTCVYGPNYITNMILNQLYFDNTEWYHLLIGIEYTYFLYNFSKMITLSICLSW